MAGPAFKTALSRPIAILFRSVPTRRGTAAAAPDINNYLLAATTAPHIKNHLLAAGGRHFITTPSSRAPHVIPGGGPSKQPQKEKGQQGSQSSHSEVGAKVRPMPHLPARAMEPAGQGAAVPKEPGLCSGWEPKASFTKSKEGEEEEAEREAMHTWMRAICIAAPIYCLLSLYAINLFSKEIQAAQETDRKNGNELEVLDNLVVWLNHRPT